MKKVYIAGKITGDPEYREKFRWKKTLLEAEGHIVLNPAELPVGMEPKDYMRICFSMMEVADEVHFLQDWRLSKGATLEFAWCSYVGKTMCFDYFRDDVQEADAHALWVGALEQAAAKFVRELCAAGPPDFVRKIFVQEEQNRGEE